MLSFSTRSLRFNPRSICMWSVMNEVALGRVCLRISSDFAGNQHFAVFFKYPQFTGIFLYELKRSFAYDIVRLSRFYYRVPFWLAPHYRNKYLPLITSYFDFMSGPTEVKVFSHVTLILPWYMGTCHHGMVRPPVGDGGSAINMDGNCEYIE